MKFSREFVQAVNTPRNSEELKTLREIVITWATTRKMTRKSTNWLSAHRIYNFVLIEPEKRGKISSRRYFRGSLTRAGVATASFIEFLAEELESRESGAGKLAVKVCDVCGDVYVQEEGGREKIFCTRKCMFRSRRKLTKAARVIVELQLDDLKSDGVIPEDCSLDDAIAIMTDDVKLTVYGARKARIRKASGAQGRRAVKKKGGKKRKTRETTPRKTAKKRLTKKTKSRGGS